jgi:hypothetical protein
MYNIHSHYENVSALAQRIVTQPKVAYLHPFGSTQPENVESIDLSGNDGPLLFCYDQEPLIPDFNRSLFRYANTHRDDQGKLRPVILLNTELDSEAKNQILAEHPFTDCYYFFHAFAAADWYRGYKYDSRLIPPNQRIIRKKYITFNRITGGARSYRSFLVAELAKNNLLEHGHVSYSDVCPVYDNSYKENIVSTIAQYHLDADYVLESKNILDTVNFPLRIDNQNKNSIPNGSQTLSAIPECMESFLHIVTETCFWENKCHLTEKIFKPIVAQQPFVLLGCANNLAYLRRYGFRTFDQWWDESYDEIEDPIARLQAVVQIVRDISELSDADLEKMLLDMQLVLNHNHSWFYSKEFLDLVWDELKQNLTLAIDKIYAK